MPERDQRILMWAEACAFLDRAERMHRQFFNPGRTQSTQPVWEPPVDIFETETDIWVVMALPGVAPEAVEIVIDGARLVVAGERRIATGRSDAVVRRLEIPHGRFEREIPLPPGRYEIERRELAHGCLMLGLAKLTRG